MISTLSPRRAVICFVVYVNHCLTLNFLTVKRVWDLVEVSDFDCLVTGTASNGANQGLTGIACCFHSNGRLLRLSRGRSQLLLFKNGFEARDFATQLSEFVRALNLASLLAQAEVDVCIVRVA